MLRLLSTAMVAMALLGTVGCDEADYGTEPDGIGVDATDGIGVDATDDTIIDPVMPRDDTDVNVDIDAEPALDTEEDDTVLLESDAPAAAPAPTPAPADASSDAGDAVEELPAETLPADQEQPEPQEN